MIFKVLVRKEYFFFSLCLTYNLKIKDQNTNVSLSNKRKFNAANKHATAETCLYKSKDEIAQDLCPDG